MGWHVFVVFGAIFCASLLHVTHGFPFQIEKKIREKRNPQDKGLFFQTSGALNLGGLNLPQVASNVRKHLHQLVDTVTNPLNIQIISQADPINVNYEYDQQYDYGDQQYQEGPPHGPPLRGPPFGPPHGNPYGPPHGHPHRPPHGHPHGPPHGPPHGQPHGHPHGPPPPPPYDSGPPSENPVYENTSEENNQNLPQTKPDFGKQPNYPGNSNVNIELSSSSPPTTTSLNLAEVNAKGANNGSEYIEDNFPVILLHENEIR